MSICVVLGFVLEAGDAERNQPLQESSVGADKEVCCFSKVIVTNSNSLESSASQ